MLRNSAECGISQMSSLSFFLHLNVLARTKKKRLERKSKHYRQILGTVRESGCVSSCLMFPDWLSRENAGPEEAEAAPPSRDNIAFLPECFRTLQLDSMLQLLSGTMG